jgi:hypothetical protein
MARCDTHTSANQATCDGCAPGRRHDGRENYKQSHTPDHLAFSTAVSTLNANKADLSPKFALGTLERMHQNLRRWRLGTMNACPASLSRISRLGHHSYLVEVPMYWMLLPPSANVQRHLESPPSPLLVSWIGAWRAGVTAVRHLLNVKCG